MRRAPPAFEMSHKINSRIRVSHLLVANLVQRMRSIEHGEARSVQVDPAARELLLEAAMLGDEPFEHRACQRPPCHQVQGALAHACAQKEKKEKLGVVN